MMNIALRRRAVLTGLRPFLDDAELLTAVSLWELEYAAQPVFALSGFVAKCCTRAELRQQRGQMLRAVISALELSEAELLPDPGASEQHQARHHEPAREKRQQADDKTRMFGLLLIAMMALLDPRSQGIVRQHLLQELRKQKFDGVRYQALHDVFSGHQEAPSQSYSLDLLQLFINQAYVVMCEIMGPVKADQLLAQAIRQTDAHEARLGFRVHDLL